MTIKNGFTKEVKPFVLVHFTVTGLGFYGLGLLWAWAFTGL